MIDLTRLLPKLLSANQNLAVEVAWARTAGATLRRHAMFAKVEQATLVVWVGDAIWQKQLEPMCAELIFRVNSLLGKKVIDTIAFRVNPSALANVSDESLRTREKKQSRDPIPDELLFAAGTIADDDLRLRFIRAAENCIARRDSRFAN